MTSQLNTAKFPPHIDWEACLQTAETGGIHFIVEIR